MTYIGFNDIIVEVKKIEYADVSELADETDSKSVVLMDVWVRVPPSALFKPAEHAGFFDSPIFLHSFLWYDENKEIYGGCFQIWILISFITFFRRQS